MFRALFLLCLTLAACSDPYSPADSPPEPHQFNILSLAVLDSLGEPTLEYSYELPVTVFVRFDSDTSLSVRVYVKTQGLDYYVFNDVAHDSILAPWTPEVCGTWKIGAVATSLDGRPVTTGSDTPVTLEFKSTYREVDGILVCTWLYP